MSTAKSTRVLAVQVPGEAPPPAAPPAPGAADAQLNLDQAPHSEVAKPETPPPAAPPTHPDLAAIRAEALEQARFEVRAELGAQIQAASTVLAQQEAPATPRHEYRNMRAADIDHTKLTAPVMTRDGYLCPPPPVAK